MFKILYNINTIVDLQRWQMEDSMIKYTEKFPIVLTARKENVPNNYVVLAKLKTGDVIAVDKDAEEFVVPTRFNSIENHQAA